MILILIINLTGETYLQNYHPCKHFLFPVYFQNVLQKNTVFPKQSVSEVLFFQLDLE